MCVPNEFAASTIMRCCCCCYYCCLRRWLRRSPTRWPRKRRKRSKLKRWETERIVCNTKVGARDCDIGRLTRTVEYMMYGFVTRVKVWENWRICGINSVSPTGWTFDGRMCRMVIAKKTCQVLRQKQFKMISDR